MNYEGKVTIVTGGSHGIGEGCVRVFAEAGSTVVFCSRRREGRQGARAQVNAGGREGVVPPLRRVEGSRGRALVDETAKRFGRIDCLINNAGWHRLTSRSTLSPPGVPDLLELNLVSMFVACQQALPHLRRTQGSIVNMSSLVGSMGQLHATTYVATKGAITAFTKALAVDEAAHGVRVNCVSPGTSGHRCGRRRWTPPRPEQDPRGRRCGAAPRPDGHHREAGRLCLFLAPGTFTTGVDHVLSAERSWPTGEEPGELRPSFVGRRRQSGHRRRR